MTRTMACLCCCVLAACISLAPEPPFDPGPDPGVSDTGQPDADASSAVDAREAEIAPDPGTAPDTADPIIPDIVEFPDHAEIPQCIPDPACDDGDPCTDDLRCPPDETCEHVFNDAPCSEGWCGGTVLFPAARCKAGTCVPSKPMDCDDDNPCTTDACTPTGCTHVSAQGYCDDGNGCTAGDLCTNGICSGAPLASCGCTGKPANYCAQFEDSNRCNGLLTCRQDIGMCVVDPASVIHCALAEGLSPLCAIPVCDPGTGTCSAAPRPGATACDDGNACTVGDACVDGVCKPGTLNSCDDGNLCTTDTCDPAAGCGHEPNTLACGPAKCEDGLFFAAVTCADGGCPAQVGVSCDDNNPCTDDGCDASGCSHAPHVGSCVLVEKPECLATCLDTTCVLPDEVPDNGIDDDCDGDTDE